MVFVLKKMPLSINSRAYEAAVAPELKWSSFTKANVPPSGSCHAKWSGWRETKPLRYSFMSTHAHTHTNRCGWRESKHLRSFFMPIHTHKHTHTHTYTHTQYIYICYSTYSTALTPQPPLPRTLSTLSTYSTYSTY